MGIWNGSTINSIETAMLFNRMYNMKSISLTQKNRPLAFAALGRPQWASTPNGVTGFKKLRRPTGKKVEIRMRGKKITPSYTARGSAELATVNLASNYATDIWGAMEFDIAHITYTHPIPHSDLDRIRGKEAKTLDYLDEIYDLLDESYDAFWSLDSSKGIHGTTAPSDTAIGGWVQMVSDGVSTGETGYAVYGTIDRSDSANADMRSLVVDAGNALNLKTIRDAQNTIKSKGGKPRLAVVDVASYSQLQVMLESYTVLDQRSDWTEFGGDWIKYGNMVFAMDADCPANTMGIFDPEHIIFWLSDGDPFTKYGVVNDPSRVSTYVIQTEMYGQMLTDKCNAHAKIKNLF